MDGESSFYTPLLQTIEEPPVSPAASVCMKVLTSILAIASITIGTIYLDSCTKQYLIPIYLIVSGSFTLFFMILSLVPCGSSGESSTGAAHKSGNVWIYSIYKPNYIDKSSSDYCDKTLYLFAFWLTTAIYILLGITLLLGCCALLCAFILSGSFLLRQRT
ncbi:transmembrane protein 272-like isoform X2 [Pristis pectinata]|uniref:transmembrane protein 272-like isoform X2 n=1 Tax=Pristis pectinata TaxID=685728 RepID=UPI00223E0F3F|nr:transmembrane protein 272-like isoform X2 [Pristis pectinata]